MNVCMCDVLFVRWNHQLHAIADFHQPLSLVSVIYEWKGLVSVGFKVGRTDFGSPWFWVVSACAD